MPPDPVMRTFIRHRPLLIVVDGASRLARRGNMYVVVIGDPVPVVLVRGTLRREGPELSAPVRMARSVRRQAREAVHGVVRGVGETGVANDRRVRIGAAHDHRVAGRHLLEQRGTGPGGRGRLDVAERVRRQLAVGGPVLVPREYDVRVARACSRSR